MGRHRTGRRGRSRVDEGVLRRQRDRAAAAGPADARAASLTAAVRGLWTRSAGAAAGASALLLLAWACGRLKALYYFSTFGVGLEMLERGPADDLFDSWFVLQNVAFFVLLLWVAVAARRAWVWIVLALYALIPLAAHYAFGLPASNPLAHALIHYRHTLLKGIPFAVLALVLWRHAECRRRLARLDWPGRRTAFWLAALAVAAWAISSAKHFGAYDAQSAIRWPDRQLARVELEETPGTDYLLHAGPRTVVTWSDRVRVTPRERLEPLQIVPPLRLQPGGRYF